VYMNSLWPVGSLPPHPAQRPRCIVHILGAEHISGTCPRAWRERPQLVNGLAALLRQVIEIAANPRHVAICGTSNYRPSPARDHHAKVAVKPVKWKRKGRRSHAINDCS
jgi:hypothetical protein